MPALPPPTTDPPWRTAWDRALYGPTGFYRRSSPREHFRTAVHGSDLLAGALVRLVRRHGLNTVVDMGAGRGELLVDLHRLAPELTLVGVEVAPRPEELPAPVVWTPELPAAVDGLVVAHEWLDNVPCHVVEVDRSGLPRLVHVDPVTGRETLGHAVDAPGVPASLGSWLERWWPLDGAPPGARAEVGTSRDRAWADLVGRVRRGLAVAVDYGHTRETRPVPGSLRSYLAGRQVPVLPDGSRDLTAGVAVDAVAAAAGSVTLTQREALSSLGVAADHPSRERAEVAPAEYLRALSRAGEAAELTAEGGFGDFYWVVSSVGVPADPFTGS
jgi:SAM-dependent MidA family methyltransferase